MNLSYQHANPATGGGSYLLRFRSGTADRTPCLLVDSGVGVDLDSLLSDDEYLAAVLLTHAHLDHYASLADSLRDGAPVYAAEPTANVLEDVLTEGEKNYEIGATGSAADAVEPLDGWETVVPDVEVAPVPAGHTPGAAGFVVRFRDGSRANHVLFTGDFTTRRAAGYPGLRADLPTGIDALFVNVSTTDDFEETLTDSLFTLLERSRAGSRTLVTASALTAVHYAYLLGHLGERLGESVPVTLAGQAAKLYADFGYDVPNVEAVPVFESPSELLERGTLTFAGPEVPTEGSARRLFGAIEDDSSATLVQLTAGATNPVETASCTVYDYEVVNHPSMSAIDELVAELDPIHVVAGHGPRRALRRFRGRYDERFVWASDDDREQTLYENGRWSPPPWLSETAVQSIRAQDWQVNGGRFGEIVAEADQRLPEVARADAPDLDAEGVVVERLDDRFGQRGTESEASPSADRPESPDATETAAGDDADSTAANGAETATGAEATVRDDETFRREVLDRLDSLASDTGGDPVRARVVDCGEGVTMLRLLDETDLDHGEEVTVVVPDDE
ncbi:MBL fold metallo-hydrolase (plasmid) [Halorussus limi]|uniref:MBL fold metallo-hydrolase n=1 Tax=Halorussus limi TaxID=2938695 RepID=A0A8U0I0Z9_9EURY|nr:MBL fold metallo-hydrolase [Halorussus limi]UPV76581.1 MBL fold metallo-hydrolase [Halorussus limi]